VRCTSGYPYFIQSLKPFLSSADIGSGARWNEALAKELEDATWGIVCVTPFNFGKVWLNFEAGALSKKFDRTRLVPLLFRVDRSELGGPLAQFQSVLCTKDDFLNLLYSINNSLGKDQVEHSILSATFEQWWPRLQDALDAIPRAATCETRTAYRWLCTTADLEDLANGTLAATKRIWVVSRGTQRLTGIFKQAILQNLQNGVTYRYFAPSGISDDERNELHQLESQSNGKFEPKFFEGDEFERSVATDYVIVNPEINEITERGVRRRMFFRAPIQATGMDYWIDVEESATVRFVERFHALWKGQPDSSREVAIEFGTPPQPLLLAGDQAKAQTA
jgi:hypothetical protein